LVVIADGKRDALGTTVTARLNARCAAHNAFVTQRAGVTQLSLRVTPRMAGTSYNI